MPHQVMKTGNFCSFSDNASEETSLATFVVLKQRLAAALKAFDDGKSTTVSNVASPLSLSLEKSLCTDSHGCKQGLVRSQCIDIDVSNVADREEATSARLIALKKRLADALTAFDEGKPTTRSNVACALSLEKSLCNDSHGCRLGLAGSQCTITSATSGTLRAAFARGRASDTVKVVIGDGGPAYILLPANTERVSSTNNALQELSAVKVTNNSQHENSTARLRGLDCPLTLNSDSSWLPSKLSALDGWSATVPPAGHGPKYQCPR